MKGLELSKNFYLEYGKKMIEEQFYEYKDRIAVGLVGEGSECFGYDDDISKDHDFDAGFCLWLCDDDEREIGFKLERAYAKLPKEFMGIKRAVLSPAGGNRRGVMTTGNFYRKFLGAPNAPNSYERWLYTPSAMLAEACNGEVWIDNLGEFTHIREILLKGYPEDVRKKKIAAHAALAGQAGQYNFLRLIKRGETGAAQLAVFEFVKHAVSLIYLLNNRYEPFYKWVYKKMRELPLLSDAELSLTGLTELGNSAKEAEGKAEIIESVCEQLIAEIKKQGLSDASCNNLDTHAYSVTDKIQDNDLRNMHVMDGI